MTWIVVGLILLWVVMHYWPWPRTKIPIDVGRINVTVAFVDNIDDVDYMIHGRAETATAYGADAKREARNFVESSAPLEVEDNQFVPRNRVRRYIVGAREEYIVWT